jgi:hypothetical protein
MTEGNTLLLVTKAGKCASSGMAKKRASEMRSLASLASMKIGSASLA